MLAGIPQTGITSATRPRPCGSSSSPTCSARSAATTRCRSLPTLVQDYVRTGKVRIEFRNLSFLGEDSVTRRRAAAAAAQQNRLWNFVDLFYLNQGEENSGYVTDASCGGIAQGAGVDPAKADRVRRRAGVPAAERRPTRSPTRSACSRRRRSSSASAAGR